MQHQRLRSGVIILSLFLLACLSTLAAAAQPTGGLIAFNSDRDGSDDLYVMNADGSGVRQLTNSDDNDYNAVWSPDGRTLAFTPYPKGARDSLLSTVTLDGAPPKAILDARLYLASPTWSPDGSQIAYGAQVNDAFGIFAVDADGLNDHAMIAPSAGVTVGSGNWIDGARILFNATGSPANVLKTANVDGSNVVTIVDEVETQLPEVSPDRQKVAFGVLYSTTEFSAWRIYVANVDGSGLSLLTPNDYNNVQIAWSPDSQQIAFSSLRDGNYEIYVMNADGSNQTNLTHSPGSDEYPTWSPDGGQIAFQSNRDGNSEIYVMNADGSNPLNVSSNPANDRWPVWQPVPGVVIAPAPSTTDAPAATTEVSASTEMPTLAPVACSMTARGTANLRSGPGTTYARSGSLAGGTSAEADGQTQSADGFTWYRLTSGAWVRGDLVTAAPECATLAVVSP